MMNLVNLEYIKNNIENNMNNVEVINPGLSFNKLFINFEKTPTLEEVCQVLKLAKADDFDIYLANAQGDENLSGYRKMNMISRTTKVYNAAIFHGTTDMFDENTYTGKSLYNSWKMNGSRNEKVLIKNSDDKEELNGERYERVERIHIRTVIVRNGTSR